MPATSIPRRSKRLAVKAAVVTEAAKSSHQDWVRALRWAGHAISVEDAIKEFHAVRTSKSSPAPSAPTPAPAPQRDVWAEADAEAARCAAEAIAFHKGYVTKQLADMDSKLFEYNETQVEYYRIYNDMFQHFYNNLSYFNTDTAYLNEMIDTAITILETAWDNFTISTSTSILRVTEKMIGAATIALRTNGRVLL
jgi:hypothetical protein